MSEKKTCLGIDEPCNNDGKYPVTEDDGTIKGYLCETDAIIVRTISRDPLRFYHVMAYLQRTRNGKEFCPACGKELEPSNRPTRRYCSDACKARSYRWRKRADQDKDEERYQEAMNSEEYKQLQEAFEATRKAG